MKKNSYQGTTEKIARAFGKELNLSTKNANETCYVINGMKVDKALKYLDRVEKMEDYVPIRRYNKRVGHRKGGKPGRYPVKVAKELKKMLTQVKANAEYKGLDTDKLKIIHATAYKGSIIPRGKPKGRMHPHNIVLANIEIVVKEA